MESGAKPTVITYCRNGYGFDDHGILTALERTGASITNFDDEKYVLPRWSGKTLWLVRRCVRGLCKAQLNRDLLAAARVLRPQLFFSFKGSFVAPETVRALRAEGIPSILYYPDISFLTPGRSFVKSLHEYRAILSNKSFAAEQLRQLGISTPCEFYPLWYDPSVHFDPYPDCEIEYTHDILFVGHHSAKKEKTLTRVAARFGMERRMLIVGSGWARTPLARYSLGSSLFGRGVSELVRRSKINLGLLTESPHTGISGDQITARTIQIPACGGFMLHERTPDAIRLLSGYDGLFSSDDELIDLIGAYLNDDARRELKRRELALSVSKLGRDSDSAARAILSLAAGFQP